MADDLSESKSNQGRVPTPRLFFVDNLRTFLIILVFLDHLAITYGSPFGSWYYHEGQVGFPEAIGESWGGSVFSGFFLFLGVLEPVYFDHVAV